MRRYPRLVRNSVPARLLDLALPVIGLNVLNVLALFVDTAMVGRLADPEPALAGMSYAFQLLFLLMVGMLGLTVGSVASVARAHGAKDESRVVHLLHQSTQLTVLVGVSIAVLGTLAAPWLLTLLGAKGAHHEQALLYLLPLLIGVVFNYLNILFGAVLRGVGNTRLAFVIALGMNGLNVVLNYGLILGNWGLPSLGVQGAAYGTLTAQIVAVVAMVLALRSGAVPGVTLKLGLSRIDAAVVRDLVRVGTPAALDMIVLNAGFLSIIAMLARVDQTAVAAHGVGLRIQAIAFVPGMAISQSASAMVGNALGADTIDEAKRIVRAAMVMCFALMSTLALILWAFDGELLLIFDVAEGTSLGEATKTWILMLALCMPPVGIWLAYGSAFSGSGRTDISLSINAVATFFIQIPLSYVLGFTLGFGIAGIWAAFPVSFVVKALMGTLSYRRGRWARTGARA